MTKSVPLRFELSEFNLPSLKVAIVAASGEQTVGTVNRIAGEIADDEQRQRRPHGPTDQSEAAISPTHPEFTESRVSQRRKQKECFGG